MTTATLHHLTINVLENQRRAAKTMLGAVRQGTVRAYGRIDNAWERGLEMGLAAKMSSELKASLLNAEKKLSGVAVDGVQQAAQFIDTRVDQAYDMATGGLRSERANQLYGTRVYGFVSQASLPLAKLSVKVSAGVADGVEKLAERVVGRDDVAAQVVKAAKVVKTRARRASKAAAEAAAQVATEAPRAARKVVAKARRRTAV